jgi:hypothetical protein
MAGALRNSSNAARARRQQPILPQGRQVVDCLEYASHAPYERLHSLCLHDPGGVPAKGDPDVQMTLSLSVNAAQ